MDSCGTIVAGVLLSSFSALCLCGLLSHAHFCTGLKISGKIITTANWLLTDHPRTMQHAAS